MDGVRIALIVIASVVGSSALAAPAPFAKPARHPPSPEALLAQMRAEGFSLHAIERGPEPGTYVVTKNVELVGLGENTCAFVPRKWTVRADSGDVRAEVRALLEAAPQKVVYRRYELRPRVPVRPAVPATK
jgi:hypothetical protein